MKYLSLFIVSITLFLSSCSVSEQQYVNTAQRSIVTYDLTNPVTLEKAVNGLNLSNLLPSPATLGEGTIAVRSIESDIDNHLDEGVLYMIEDNLIELLINRGYNVVERDPDALNNLYRESSLKFKKENPKYNNLNSIDNLDKLAGPNIEARGSVISKNSVEEFIETQINSATYILSYRVLECGVVYNEIINNYELLERSSRTRLHCRLTNTKSSKIYAAGLVENEFIDKVYISDVRNLQKISYKYYDHTLPLQSEDSGTSAPIKVNQGTTHYEETKVVTYEAPEKESPKIKKKSKGYPLTKWLSIPIIALIFGSD